jgi:hypothetical protein
MPGWCAVTLLCRFTLLPAPLCHASHAQTLGNTLPLTICCHHEQTVDEIPVIKLTFAVQALITFLYVDFLDATGTLFSMVCATCRAPASDCRRCPCRRHAMVHLSQCSTAYQCCWH